MDVEDKIENIKTKRDFIDFLNALSKDRCENENEWANQAVEDYLESVASWVEDMDIESYCKSNNLSMPNNESWRFIAELFYVGKIYE